MNTARGTANRPSGAPRRLVTVAALLVLLGAPAVWLTYGRSRSGPVGETTLEQTGVLKMLGVRNWRNLPFTLSPAEERDVKRCVALGRQLDTTVNGVSPFVGEKTRRELETILRGRPGFFYAEHLLGLWHQEHGVHSKSRSYYEQALEHAPAVLVQPYRFRDGRPLAGSVIARMEIECNRVRNGSLDPSLNLAFFRLRTDKQGSVRVPVYRTVYRVSSVSHPDGFDVEHPRLGWFEVRRKIGVLPAATVEPDADESARR